MKRCKVKSIDAVVQQLVTNYLKNGYHFYVSGFIPSGKDPFLVDAKLSTLYETNLSKDARYYRKSKNRSTIQYIRYNDLFWLLARKGEHDFFQKEQQSIKDARLSPIIVDKYSINFQKSGKVTAKFSNSAYKALKGKLEFMATRQSKQKIENYIFYFPIQPYAGVRLQLKNILKDVNRLRKSAHKEKISTQCIRKFRNIKKVYSE